MTDKEIISKLKTLGWGMYNSYQYLTNDTRQIREAMEKWYNFINFELNKDEPEEPSIPDIVDEHFWEMLGEEPVNEELKEAGEAYMNQEINEEGADYVDEEGDYYYYATALDYAFRAGAQWQKQQMMKQAKPAEVNYWNQRGLSIRLEDVEVEDLAEEGEKVKIIIIKED